MTEISFYQLTTSPLHKALPSLVEKAYESGARVLVLVDKSSLKQLDDTLWTAYQQKFIPHGIKDPAKQPVFLTESLDYADNDNREVLIVTDGSKVDEVKKFSKLLDIFEGSVEKDLEHARKRYKGYKDQGFDLKYWSQDNKGKWISN